MSVVYQTSALSTGDGRNGHVETDDDALSVDLATPRMRGGQGGATNPEQLFAAGWAGCFHSAVKAAARARSISLDGSTVSVDVGLVRGDDGFRLKAAITGTLPGVDRATAEELLAQAHRGCPYSRATRGNIEVTVTAA